MPTRRPDKGGRWMGRVRLSNGQQVTKMFPAGRKGGPEWRAAKQWEEDTKQHELTEPILSDFDIFRNWCRDYINYSKHQDAAQTTQEKHMVLRRFFLYCYDNGIDAIHKITPRVIADYLSAIYMQQEIKRPKVINKHLKNLKTAWNWGAGGNVDGFPLMQSPFRKSHKYNSEENTRHVPTVDDVIKVIKYTKGQDRVMMLLFFYTAARAGEVFRLKWSDVDFEKNCIYLQDHKGGEGHKHRRRMIQMHPILAQELHKWYDTRECKVDTVFYQEQNDANKGQPFTHRSHFLPKLCAKPTINVKPFGFHGLRHLAASIVYANAGPQGLLAAQTLLGHYRATTTDRYVASAGLYAGQDAILDALSKSEIGQAIAETVGSLGPETEIPSDAANIRGNVTRNG